MEQIIPTPEAKDFMVGISEKEKEQQSTERGLVKRFNLRFQFWEKMLTALEESGVTLFRQREPRQGSLAQRWLRCQWRALHNDLFTEGSTG